MTSGSWRSCTSESISGVITQSTRANRYSALLDRYTTKVERACAPQGRAYEAAMLAAIKSFAAPRTAPLAAATAALAAK